MSCTGRIIKCFLHFNQRIHLNSLYTWSWFKSHQPVFILILEKNNLKAFELAWTRSIYLVCHGCVFMVMVVTTPKINLYKKTDVKLNSVPDKLFNCEGSVELCQHFILITPLYCRWWIFWGVDKVYSYCQRPTIHRANFFLKKSLSFL